MGNACSHTRSRRTWVCLGGSLVLDLKARNDSLKLARELLPDAVVDVELQHEVDLDRICGVLAQRGRHGVGVAGSLRPQVLVTWRLGETEECFGCRFVGRVGCDRGGGPLRG